MKNWKKTVAGILAVGLVVSNAFFSYAQEAEVIDPTVIDIQTNADNIENKASENAASLFDHDTTTKWFTGNGFNKSAVITWKYNRPVKISSYTLVSANDKERRDPRSWTLYASKDGNDFSMIDEQVDCIFSDRFEEKEFEVASSVKNEYSYFRIEFETNLKNQNDAFQLADLNINEISTVKPTAIPEPTPTASPTPNLIVEDGQITPGGDLSSGSELSSSKVKIGKAKIRKAKILGKKKVKIYIKKTSNAKTYQVRYRIGKKGKYHTLKADKKLTKVIKVKQKKTYYIQVRAKNGNNSGKWSKVKKVQVK